MRRLSWAHCPANRATDPETSDTRQRATKWYWHLAAVSKATADTLNSVIFHAIIGMPEDCTISQGCRSIIHHVPFQRRQTVPRVA